MMSIIISACVCIVSLLVVHERNTQWCAVLAALLVKLAYGMLGAYVHDLLQNTCS